MSKVAMSCSSPRVHKGELRLELFILQTFFVLKREHDWANQRSLREGVWPEHQPEKVNCDRNQEANASLLIGRLVGVSWCN